MRDRMKRSNQNMELHTGKSLKSSDVECSGICEEWPNVLRGQCCYGEHRDKDSQQEFATAIAMFRRSIEMIQKGGVCVVLSAVHIDIFWVRPTA